ncbi:MAG: GTPase HflX [Anaerolineae bacterium]|nr:GTPase HflX [Anaerolineae bacterium]
MVRLVVENEAIYPEKAVLVGVHVRGSHPLLSMHESLDELELLAKTAGIEIVGRSTQNLQEIDPSTYIGSGKVQEIIELLKETSAKIVIFDDELSPRHQRDLSEIFGNSIKLLDRSALILDVFAQHASTREGALQVELAQYEYRLPRLTRQWTHLARQGGGGVARGGNGGVGLRGPGETQLEVDKREIKQKIKKLKEDLDQVRRHRSKQRTQRRKSGIPVVALVGYTNAGKSTLLNTITQANVYVADQLFATLDPTTRKLALPSGREILMTDTVGFIQKLPTTLVAAFRATLEEISEASLILHVVDVSHPHALAHIEAVEDTLAEIDVPPVPRLLVWNKMDRWRGDVPSIPNSQDYADQVQISARANTGIEKLLTSIEAALTAYLRAVRFVIPHDRGDLVASIYDLAHVLERVDCEQGVVLTAQVSLSVYNRYKRFALREE